MAQIARLTTPAFTYKPSAVEVPDINKIYLVIKQGATEIVRKDITQASISQDGFTWTLSQTETEMLILKQSAIVQVDYLTTAGMRYTTIPKAYEITNSAINEVL